MIDEIHGTLDKKKFPGNVHTVYGLPLVRGDRHAFYVDWPSNLV